jgi:hypothetical protein
VARSERSFRPVQWINGNPAVVALNGVVAMPQVVPAATASSTPTVTSSLASNPAVSNPARLDPVRSSIAPTVARVRRRRSKARIGGRRNVAGSIAAALYDRGIPTASGRGTWQAVQASRVLARLAA